MKNAKTKSIFIIFMIAMLSLFCAYATMTITVNHPSDEWVHSNSVMVNITPDSTGVAVLPYCAVYENSTGTSVLRANYTNVPNSSDFVRGISIPDSIGGMVYTLNVTCSNGTNEAKSGGNFGVDGSIPSIVLNSPVDDSYSASKTVTFSYTPTDPSNLEDCLFYLNSSGSWPVNKSNSTAVTANADSFSKVFANDGVYIWNVWCNDTSNNTAWAEDSNRTLFVDSTAPNDIKFITTNNTFSNDTTPYISWNRTVEANFYMYELLVSNNISYFDNSIIQTKQLFTITENATTLNELASGDQYYMKVRAVDLAGNVKNTTSIIYYTIDLVTSALTLNYPSNNTYSNSRLFPINVTLVDENPSTCDLWLSNSSGTGGYSINKSKTGVSNSTVQNLTTTSLPDGTYTFYVECNDTVGRRVNATSTPYQFVIDGNNPPEPYIVDIAWGQTNNTDLTPVLSWRSVVETNFERYLAKALYKDNASVAYEVNVSGASNNYTAMSLRAGKTYNFTVTAYDLAGNSNQSKNTTSTMYYVDPVCGTLSAGWNLCGATWTSGKNLTQIGRETGATFVTVWNSSNQWQTCVYGVSETNCGINTGISNSYVGHVWVYMNSSVNWRNRTWSATQTDANITLSNITNGWNIVPGEFRGGRKFGHLGRVFTGNNVTMFSIPYNNGTSAPYVNKLLFSNMSMNETMFDYGRAMWVYYNSSGTTTFDVGTW